MILKSLLPALTFFCLAGSLSAQTFDASISDPSHTTSFADVACRNNGDAIVLGEMTDSNFPVEMIVALQPGGQPAWIRSYPNGVNNFFTFNRVIASPGNALTIFGDALSVGPPFNGYDPIILRTDSQGQFTWGKQYVGSFSDYPGNFRAAHDGGYISCGMSMDQSGGSSYFFLLKTDSAGNRQWGKLFYHPFFDKIGMNDVLEDANGDYYACGHIDDTALVMKVSHHGTFLWMKKLSFSNSFFTQPYSLTHSHHKDAFICSGMTLGGSFALEMDTTGNINWCKNYTYTTAGFLATDIATSPDGGYCLAGNQSAQLVYTTKGALVKIDSVGQVQWNHLYTSGYGGPFSALDTLHGVSGYTTAGMHHGPSGYGNYGYAVRTDIAGNLFCGEQTDSLTVAAIAIKPIDLYPTVSDYFTVTERNFTEQPYTYSDSILCPTTGISAATEPEGALELYPVPAGDQLHISFPFAAHWQLEVLDVTGRLLMREVIDGKASQLHTSAVPAGMYFIRATDGTKSFGAKFTRRAD